MAIKANYFFDPLLGRPKLRSNLPDKVDTVVIGGGIAGLTILYFLLMNKKNAIMLDETEVGFRSSGRSLGCVGFPNVHNTHLRDFNVINEAIRCNNNVLIELIKKESIGCDFSYAGEVQISDQDMNVEQIMSMHLLLGKLPNTHFAKKVLEFTLKRGRIMQQDHNYYTTRML